MGMSASQARFLGLTARKSNTEYQGQQVNQQRTALANESAGLYRQLSSLTVPVPPSATDFYSMAYTFSGETSAEECRITNWSACDQTSAMYNKGAYSVTVKKTIDDVGVKTTPMGIGTQVVQTTNEDGSIEYEMQIPNGIGGYSVYEMTKADYDVNGVGVNDNNAEYEPSYTYQRNGYTYYVAESLLTSMFGDQSEKFNVTTEGNQKTSHITSENQDDATESYYKGDKTVKYETYDGVSFVTDSAGRYTSMTYSPTNNPNNMKTIDLTIEEVQDEQGYDEALQQYNYKKMLYDRTVDDINNRTEVIQQEDKVLELNLKQLDTEQEALQTEMDSVKKVIDKNVESSFKTFA